MGDKKKLGRRRSEVFYGTRNGSVMETRDGPFWRKEVKRFRTNRNF